MLFGFDGVISADSDSTEFKFKKLPKLKLPTRIPNSSLNHALIKNHVLPTLFYRLARNNCKTCCTNKTCNTIEKKKDWKKPTRLVRS